MLKFKPQEQGLETGFVSASTKWGGGNVNMLNFKCSKFPENRFVVIASAKLNQAITKIDVQTKKGSYVW